MAKIKRIFFCLVLMFIFFIFGAHEILAASTINNINNWTWNGNRLCWNTIYRKSVTFTVTPAMLSGGNFYAEIYGSSKNGHTFMYMDAEAELNQVLNNHECYQLEYPVPAKNKMIFHTYSPGTSEVYYPIENHNFGALAVGSTHTITCWGFAGTVDGGSGGCEFGLKPTCNLMATPANIQVGDSSTLSWTTTEALSASINPGGAVGSTSIANGSLLVTPKYAGKNPYIMTVNGVVSNQTCQADINVEQPTCAFSISPTYVIYGDKATLSWQTVGVTSAVVDNANTGSRSTIDPANLASGSMDVAPLVDTTYSMIANSLSGPIVCPLAKVTVSAPLPKNEGLVPCARINDDLTTTDVNEAQSCSICTFFLMVKKIINFIMLLALGLGVFVFVVIGLLYMSTGGNIDRIRYARVAINSTVTGIIIIFIVWAIIAIILQAMGYAKVSVWSQVSCSFGSVPSPVINLKMTPGNDMNTLTWDPPLVDVEGLPILYYNIYCGTSPHPTKICNLGSPTGYHFSGTTFEHVGLENGKSYYYIVAAVNVNGEGIWSNEVGTIFDCDVSNPNVFQWKTVAVDKDYDRYGTSVPFPQCVGAEIDIGGFKYYKDISGNFFFIDAADMLGSGDCNDDNKLVWRNRYADSDADGYCNNNTLVCVGDEPGYIDACGTCLIGGITDCNPYDGLRWCERYYDHDKDGYGDANIDIYGDPSTFGLGPLFCVGNHLGFSDNNTDCDPDNGCIYQRKDVVYDSDHDGFSIWPTDYLGAPVPWYISERDDELRPSQPLPPFECVGDAITYKNTRDLTRTYYRNNECAFDFVDAADASKYWLNSGVATDFPPSTETDCDPNNVCIYQMKRVATDRDHDRFISDAVSWRCVGDKVGSWYKNYLCQTTLIDETAIMQYGTPGSHVTPDDCRDDIASVNKHGVEAPNCDNLDNDCDGTIDSFSWPCGWGCCEPKWCSGGTWSGCCACPPPPASS